MFGKYSNDENLQLIKQLSNFIHFSKILQIRTFFINNTKLNGHRVTHILNTYNIIKLMKNRYLKAENPHTVKVNTERE